ncbi:NAD(P)-binding protein [Delitschia confertaspora ATCC 74209]|uniref:NAD(P)-binding protein n=1 Tax=Delitschia confertaspora ATCC 74209 TaxID=1513339 RepID=A0A9P4JBQ9_9PLEO|nr:NAD(P)-binding protein [Delitschia confertaspora ATCC 74209]
MTKTIVVMGGTGQQGGGVNVMLQTPSWKVSVIKRNTSSSKAKGLVSKGAEVVKADSDDEPSMKKAFEEEQQAMTIARAASMTAALEHFIWSTLPNTPKMTNGKAQVPHFDYKAKVDERIRKELPELAKKTSYLMFGEYPLNCVFYDFMKPFEVPGSGKHVFIYSTPSAVKIPWSGNMSVSGRIWVRQLLSHAPKSFGKYAVVVLSGKDAVYVQCSYEEYERVWGMGGRELGNQLKFGGLVEDCTVGYDVMGMDELEIKKEEVGGVRESFEGVRGML